MEPTHTEYMQSEDQDKHDQHSFMTPLQLHVTNPLNQSTLSPLILPEKIYDLEMLVNQQSREFIMKYLEQYINQAKTCMLNKNYAAASKLYELILEAQPNRENAQVMLGRAAFLNKEYQRAIQAYQNLMKNWKIQNDQFILFDMAVSLFKVESYTQAESAFLSVIQQDPTFPKKGLIFIYLGTIKKLNGNYKAALEYFLQSLNEEPHSQPHVIQILCNIGLCLDYLKLQDEASQIYQRARDIDEKNFDALKCSAWHQFRFGNYKETLELMSNSDDSNVEYDFDCLFMIAKCFEAQNLIKEALKSLNKALRIQNNNAAALCSLGMIFYKCKQQQEAFNLFQHAYHLDPNQLESLYNMAIIYENSKFFSEAVAIYNKILQVNPDDPQVIKRKLGLENNKPEPLNDQFREPEFKCNLKLWLENQFSSEDQQQLHHSQSPLIWKNNSRNMFQQKQKYQTDEFGQGFTSNCAEYDNNLYQTNNLIGNTPLLQPYGGLHNMASYNYQIPPLGQENVQDPLQSPINQAYNTHTENQWKKQNNPRYEKEEDGINNEELEYINNYNNEAPRDAESPIGHGRKFSIGAKAMQRKNVYPQLQQQQYSPNLMPVHATYQSQPQQMLQSNTSLYQQPQSYQSTSYQQPSSTQQQQQQAIYQQQYYQSNLPQQQISKSSAQTYKAI